MPRGGSASGLKRWYRQPALLGAVLLLTACGESDTARQSLDIDPRRIVNGDPDQGRRIIAAIECGVCHRIPGIAGAHGIVGPPLAQFRDRPLIAGVVPNRPAILVQWVRNAPDIAPHTGMPNLGLTEEEARHVAAYLYTLD